MVVVDAEIDFRQHWTNSSLSLAVSPQDAHLNTLALNLLMRRAALALNAHARYCLGIHGTYSTATAAD